MRSVFLDTNVLIYAATGMTDAPEKHAIASELVSGSEYGISAQVLAEFVSAARRRRVPPLSEDRISWWLSELEVQDSLPVDAAIVRRGFLISAEHGLNYYDGANLAAAERLGCDTVLSEDMTDGRAYGGVTVRNPFRDS
jgi:predicted nucleic acid-binding protein